ncbi:putative ubiquitin fusion degradation protein Ufd1 [Talaromyces proteolyticus]|uniref:Ubiquitin fusion degradation protein 1 n=1 Tax=Talaromyces proteolyticus TaxID=1131652 RepID=A0AAD4KGD7_9EURO|nr:putative ubiquitin fusion degradation protein Ufd1 [Talaromyces proteolyticus]KAH8691135.1 putative ubiquitin fusion degradation protein Ufd1 [Talaromyces proteolyticus]
MYRPGAWDADPMDGILGGAMRYGGAPRRFDEYYRCYPVVMMPGPERENVNHGGKVIMPPSALDKLTRLHITYPMLFELHNGAKEKMTHAGVLEFIAEEGKIYLPFWLMQTLLLEPGDLIQVKSTDLPQGRFIKLQPQSTSFLDISDPKAVLENAFRNFSCLTKGDVFTFAYNDQIYEVAVLDAKPDGEKKAISVLETDLEVDFAPPIGYEEPSRTSGTSTPRSALGAPAGGLVHSHGSMAQAINYAAIAPEATDAANGARAVSSNFIAGGHRLNAKKNSKAPTPQASTPIAGKSTNPEHPPPPRRTNGPQPLRLAPNKLFFGYALKPVQKRDEQGKVVEEDNKPKFQGQGQTLRPRKKGLGDSGTPTSGSDVEGRKR